MYLHLEDKMYKEEQFLVTQIAELSLFRQLVIDRQIGGHFYFIFIFRLHIICYLF